MNADFYDLCSSVKKEMQLATDTTEKFYPDLIEKGGLVSALQFALIETNSTLEVKASGISGFPVYARVELNKRFSQIYIGSEQRMFISDFWQDGIALGNAHTDSLTELAKVLKKWLETTINLTELSEEFEFVKPDEKAKYFEAGREVEWQWKSLQNYIPRDFPTLILFLNEANQNTVLNQLFPYTSMNTFHFSRCTGYPFSKDCPIVIPIENTQYKVVNSKGEYLGEGNEKEAVELVVKNLPANIGKAMRGTAEDL
jgi:Family of unknown function (DUF6193)